MNNVVRKAVRVIVDQLDQLQHSCFSEVEINMIREARIYLIRADYHDFHINPNKRYVEPKTDFKFVKK